MEHVNLPQTLIQRRHREPLRLLVGGLLSVHAVMAVQVAPVIIVVAFLILVWLGPASYPD